MIRTLQEQIRDLVQTRGLVHMQDLLEEVAPDLDAITKAVDTLITEGAIRPYEFAPKPCQAFAYNAQLGGGRPRPIWEPGSKVFWYLARCRL